MNKLILANGVEMPLMGIGTNWMNFKELKNIILAGLKAGFRAIDTARDYGNEAIVGAAIASALNELGMSRNEIFITTKIGNSQQRKGDIFEELEISLQNLQTDYIDLWLMHWPYPDFYISTWKKMVDLYRNTNKIKAIGVANYEVRHLEKLRELKNTIVPMVNQIEFHPLRTANQLHQYMQFHGIKMQAYAPLCRLIQPLKESKVVNDLSKKYNKSAGQIILRWHLQQGDVMPIFKSYKPNRFQENIDIFDFTLTLEELKNINALDQDYKYHLASSSCPGY